MTDSERDLPRGWVRTKLRSIATLVSGQHIRSDKYVDRPTGLPYLTGPADFADTYPVISKWTDHPKAVANENDVLVTVKGAGVGKTNILNVPRASISRQLMAIRGHAVLSKYMYYYLTANFNEFQRIGAGSTVPGITRKQVLELQLPLAPLNEQRRIVDKIDELFSDLDAGLEGLKVAQRQLERYRQSVLKAAVEGDLTRDWRLHYGGDSKLAEKLLARILSERRGKWEAEQLAKYEVKGKKPPSGWRKRYKKPTTTTNPLSTKHPHSWAITSLDSLLSEPLRNGRSGRTKEDGVRVLTLTAVTNGDFSEANTKLADVDPARVADLWLKRGDILIERSNTPELVGTTRLYSGPDDFAIFPDLIIRARLNQNVLPRYAEVVLQSQAARRYFRQEAQGISGSMPKINQSTVEAFPFPLPTLEEQEQIVAQIDKILSVIRASKNAIAAEVKRAGKLRLSILALAFSGGLTQQDPHGKPAADGFVERINAGSPRTRTRSAPKSYAHDKKDN